jgi:hypothetical protein
MASRSAWRPHEVHCPLSPEEYAALVVVRTEGAMTVREVFLLGLRAARRVVAKQRRLRRLMAEVDHVGAPAPLPRKPR